MNLSRHFGDGLPPPLQARLRAFEEAWWAGRCPEPDQFLSGLSDADNAALGPVLRQLEAALREESTRRQEPRDGAIQSEANGTHNGHPADHPAKEWSDSSKDLPTADWHDESAIPSTQRQDDSS